MYNKINIKNVELKLNITKTYISFGTTAERTSKPVLNERIIECILHKIIKNILHNILQNMILNFIASKSDKVI